ncbi:hypothetical protein FGIG_00676, partial [Fasciola gigantica]
MRSEILKLYETESGDSTHNESVSHSLEGKVANDQHSVNEKTLNTIERNFHVDDCLVSAEGVQEAITLVEQLRNVLIRRGFRLNKWVYNTEAAIKTIAPSEQAPTLISLSPSDPMTQKTLDLYWR